MILSVQNLVERASLQILFFINRGFSEIMQNKCITLAVLGNGTVGKSSLINNFRSDGFVSVYKQTVGCEFYEKKVSIRESLVSLRVWDIGGQSIHSKSIQQYVSTSDAIFLVYDVTNRESFIDLSDWKSVLDKHGVTGNVYLVGNKIDMIGQRQVTVDQHEHYVAETGFRGSIFMSAKTGENVVRMFYKVAGEVLGVHLSENELDIHHKVLKVSVIGGSNQLNATSVFKIGDNDDASLHGGRTAFADQIEAEDRAAAEAAKRKQEQCMCNLQ